MLMLAAPDGHWRVLLFVLLAVASDTGGYFVGGSIYNAMWANLRGEEAFYAMLRLKTGEFALDPNHQGGEQVISATPEALLLEGMRRLDEGIT